MATAMKTTDLRALLRAWFEKEAYAVLEEVSDDAGYDRSRSADMIVQGLWPSRGLLLEGIEIKVSRADWIKELRDPAKAETFVRWCDKWWIASGDPSIIQAGELPDTWGHISVVNGKLKVIKPAPKLTAQPLERGFLAAMLKRATKLPTGTINDLVQEQLKLVLESKLRDRAYRFKRTEDELADLRSKVHTFERATGLSVQYPDPARATMFHALKNLSELQLPGTAEVLDSLGRMESTVTEALLGIQRVREAYGPSLAEFRKTTLVQLPDPVPTSLLRMDDGGMGWARHEPTIGYVVNLTQRDVEREKVRCSRGYLRIWEPPLIGAARTHGTKHRPSVRLRSEGEIVPNYRLRIRSIVADGCDLEMVLTEVADTEPSWDILALVPDGWVPKQPDARQLPLVLTVDERQHQAWAIPMTTSVPVEQLGTWIMSGELQDDQESA